MYRSSLKSNLTDQVVFVQNGIDETRRNTTMHIDKKNNGGSFVDFEPSVGRRKQHLDGFKKEHPVIETVLLSDVVEAAVMQENPSRIIIKMDIEGFECKAILGKQFLFLLLQNYRNIRILNFSTKTSDVWCTSYFCRF